MVEPGLNKIRTAKFLGVKVSLIRKDIPTNTYRKAAKFWILLVSLLGITVSCLANNQDPFNVAGRFTEALMENDAETAKMLTTSENWPLIDDWVSAHEAFSCPYKDLESGNFSVGRSTSDHLWNISVGHQCLDREDLYCFRIDNIIVEQGENETLVLSWEFSCEANDYCTACP